MDIDKLEKDSSTMHKTTENTNIQNKLYSWLKEKGLINKLQAQIREQMILALKDSPMWNTNKVNVTSPKVQALNLLVADFLINQENLFTLSVLIMEVPLLGNLREFSLYVNRLSGNFLSENITKPSFQLNDVQDILEALGIQRNSVVTELTCQYYFNNKDNLVHSLLVCLFKAITTIKNSQSEDEIQNDKKSTKIKSDNFEHKLNSWLLSVEDILSSFNLNEEQRNIFKKLLKNAQETAMYKEHLQKLERQNKEMVERVTEVEQILATNFTPHDTSLLYKKKQIEYVTQQLRSEQQQLYQRINILEEKEKSVQEKIHRSEEEYNKKLLDIENQRKELRLKELEIQRLNEESLNNTREIKITESCQVKQLQEQIINLAKQLQDIKSKLDESERFKTNEQTNLKNIDNKSQLFESSLDRDTVKKLRKENYELRTFIKVQQERIEELSNRASNLAREIEKTHKIIPDYQTLNVKKKLQFINDTKKKKYSNQNISSTTTDHSTTLLESEYQTEDDMIQEARSRLKMLEVNTAKVEQNLKNSQLSRVCHNSDNKISRSSRKSYYDIRSNLSDDSDFDVLKSSSNKINLKELANKIGYHRSVRRSMNPSPTENDTSSEILQNTRFQNYSDVTNVSPKQISSPSVKNPFRESPVNKLRTDFPVNKENPSQHESSFTNELLPNTNISGQCQLENQIQTESVSMNNIEMKHHNSPLNESNISYKPNANNYNTMQSIVEKINLPLIPNVSQEDSSNGIDTSFNKKGQESDNTISFGSNKTDKSSDFW